MPDAPNPDAPKNVEAVPVRHIFLLLNNPRHEVVEDGGGACTIPSSYVCAGYGRSKLLRLRRLLNTVFAVYSGHRRIASNKISQRSRRMTPRLLMHDVLRCSLRH